MTRLDANGPIRLRHLTPLYAMALFGVLWGLFSGNPEWWATTYAVGLYVSAIGVAIAWIIIDRPRTKGGMDVRKPDGSLRWPYVEVGPRARKFSALLAGGVLIILVIGVSTGGYDSALSRFSSISIGDSVGESCTVTNYERNPGPQYHANATVAPNVLGASIEVAAWQLQNATVRMEITADWVPGTGSEELRFTMQEDGESLGEHVAVPGETFGFNFNHGTTATLHVYPDALELQDIEVQIVSNSTIEKPVTSTFKGKEANAANCSAKTGEPGLPG